MPWEGWFRVSKTFLPGLDDLFGPQGPGGLEDLPGLEEMLDEMFGTTDIPPELRQLLEELLGVPAPAAPGEGETS